MIPEGQPKNQDLIDAVITASQKTTEITQKDGTITKEQLLDDDTIWTKLLSVNANTLGQCIFELKEFERTGNDAPRNMCQERAEDLMHDIAKVGQSFRRSLDAKSAETMGVVRHNSQTNLLGMIGRNKQERIVNFKGDAKRSFMDSLLNRESERTADEE